jgi:hypothetical protein
MAHLTRCDQCGVEMEYAHEWLKLERPYKSVNDSVMVIGAQTLDFCSEECVVKFLTKGRD